jgi:hypothetical protein
MMNVDLGTFAGILGVILTIIFFVIGYRQTIGAKKERAAAAEREISETLLRRLTLEIDFSITQEDIERFVSGKALENRVRRSDVLTSEELWMLLYARIVSSDYLSAKQRKLILEKVNKCFKPLPRGDLLSLAPQTANKAEAGDERQLIYIGLTSTIMVAVLGAITSKFVEYLSFQPFVLIAGTLSLATATALTLYYWVREKNTATRPDLDLALAQTRTQEFESNVIQRLKATGIDVSLNQTEFDVVIRVKGRQIGVELRLNPPQRRMAVMILKRMDRALRRLGYDEGYLVVGTAIPEQIRDMSTDTIKVLQVDEFLNRLTEPAPILPAAAKA